MLRVRDIMTTDVLAVSPQTSLLSAVQLFASRHVTGAPVVEGSKVVGVVSVSDVMDFSGFDAEPERAGGEGIEPEGWANAAPRDGLELDDEPDSARSAGFFGADIVDELAELGESTAGTFAGHDVSEVMTRRILAVAPDDAVADAAKLMQRAKVHRVLVMENERLLGIVTAMDMAKAVADGRLTRHTYVFNREMEFEDR